MVGVFFAVSYLVLFSICCFLFSHSLLTCVFWESCFHLFSKQKHYCYDEVAIHEQYHLSCTIRHIRQKSKQLLTMHSQ